MWSEQVQGNNLWYSQSGVCVELSIIFLFFLSTEKHPICCFWEELERLGNCSEHFSYRFICPVSSSASDCLTTIETVLVFPQGWLVFLASLYTTVLFFSHSLFFPIWLTLLPSIILQVRERDTLQSLHAMLSVVIFSKHLFLPRLQRCESSHLSLMCSSCCTGNQSGELMVFIFSKFKPSYA